MKEKCCGKWKKTGKYCKSCPLKTEIFEDKKKDKDKPKEKGIKKMDKKDKNKKSKKKNKKKK